VGRSSQKRVINGISRLSIDEKCLPGNKATQLLLLAGHRSRIASDGKDFSPRGKCRLGSRAGSSGPSLPFNYIVTENSRGPGGKPQMALEMMEGEGGGKRTFQRTITRQTSIGWIEGNQNGFRGLFAPGWPFRGKMPFKELFNKIGKCCPFPRATGGHAGPTVRTGTISVNDEPELLASPPTFTEGLEV